MRTPLLRDNKKSGLLLISQPDTPGLLPIPKTSDEVQVIQSLIKERISRVRCLEGVAATIDQTASELGAYSSVHFACHASQDTTQPLKSGFALNSLRSFKSNWREWTSPFYRHVKRAQVMKHFPKRPFI